MSSSSIFTGDHSAMCTLHQSVVLALLVLLFGCRGGSSSEPPPARDAPRVPQRRLRRAVLGVLNRFRAECRDREAQG